MNIFEFIQNNFLHVFPILLAGFLALAIIAERVQTLFMKYPLKNPVSFFEKQRLLISKGKFQEALHLAEEHKDKPIAQVFRAGLLRAHLPDDSIEQGLALTVAEWGRNVSKRTSYLATIANVATLLGLFGTIIGLIHSFEAVSAADPAQKAALLTQGISTAMNATMMGLGVAIPCMVAFSFLVSRSQKLQSEIEDSALRVLDSLRLRLYTLDKGTHLRPSVNEKDEDEGDDFVSKRSA